MPVYCYQCPECQREEEHEQRMSDAPLTQMCFGRVDVHADGSYSIDHQPELMKRVIAGGTTFSLKGGGWASTGYRK